MRQGYAVNDFDYRRAYDRITYSAEIVFNHENRLHTGSLKDISLGGAYIETYCVSQFSTEDIVTLSIPFPSGQNNVKRKGCIKWLNHTGFSVEFV